MKPGDMIEWVYKSNEKPVHSGEALWSSIHDCWVPIGEQSLLIAIFDNKLTWMNSKGTFSALTIDAVQGVRFVFGGEMVAPRVV